jgi:outer membrane protein assembly factor BamD
MKFRIYIILIIGLLVVSCGEYNKLLKSTDYELKKNKVKEYFDDGQFVKASELLGQVLPRYRASEEAEGLTWLSAQSYYGMKDYILAAAEFRNFADMYPYSQHAEEANFLSALCDYNLAPRAELDQEYTRNAIEGFNIFISRFPSSQRVQEAQKYINILRERLVEKSYLSAKLYYNMKQYKAAVTALTNSLEQFPVTKYREEMMYFKLSSLFLYAQNSVADKQTERYQATLDDYYSFIEEFPKSVYSKEVSRIYQATSKILNITSDSQTIN